jgi:prophage tail gpP-like protein
MTVHVTVQGWWHGTSGIWRAGSIVELYSPMIPYQGAMKVKTVTYTQDSQRGTETEMELVVPWALRDQHVWDTSTPPPGTTVTPEQQLPLNAQPALPRVSIPFL